VFPNIEIRHLHAVIAMAEELSFTRAALKLHITQPALSKQITELEEEHGFPLFARTKNRIIELTDAGRVVVEQARSSLSHIDRSFSLGRAAHEGCDSVLMIGHSLYADREWIAAVFAVRLPLYPKLRVLLRTHFAMESVQSVLVGEIDLALVTAPPKNDQIVAVPYASAPLYAAIPVTHRAARKQQLVLEDLADDQWILFPKRFDPIVFEAIMDTARRSSIIPKHAHDIITPQLALDLVSDHLGVAILAKPMAPGFHADGVVVRPLCDTSLWFETCIIMRRGDSRLAKEFFQSFLLKYAPQRVPPQQLELSLPA
jgi:DNA-binding transcriptional LysR family regulator